ncbi:adenosine receptor A2a-like [Oculina patagonica]
MNKMAPGRGTWFWALGGILSILTVLGNSLVIYLIISKKRLHKTVNWFLLSLAVADLCVGLVHFPTMACISASLCSKCITTAVRWLFLNLSMTNLCALTVDRYIAIVTPLKYAVFKTKRRHLFLFSAAWILPFVVHFVPFTWMYCAGMRNAVRVFYTVVLFVFRLPPFLLLFSTCSRTLYIAQKQKKRAIVQLNQLKFNGFSRHDLATVRAQNRTCIFAKALGIIVAIFLICYAIDIARLICFTFHCITYIPWIVAHLQDLLFVFNSASNPLVYAFLKQDIRRELKSFVKCLVP